MTGFVCTVVHCNNRFSLGHVQFPPVQMYTAITGSHWGMSNSPLLTPWPWTLKPSRWLMSCLLLVCLVSFLLLPFFPASERTLPGDPRRPHAGRGEKYSVSGRLRGAGPTSARVRTLEEPVVFDVWGRASLRRISVAGPGCLSVVPATVMTTALPPAPTVP